MLFEGMLVFQLAGALILLMNSINGSKSAVIKNCFPGSNVVERDDDNNCVLSKWDLRISAHKIYLNITAFFDLVVGYGIAAFSPTAADSTVYTVVAVLGGAILLTSMEYGACKLFAYLKYKDDLIIAYSELEKHGVETTMTGKEVDEMLKDVFKG